MRTRALASVVAIGLLLVLAGSAWAAYRRVFVFYDSSPSGIFDPSLAGSWMAYSGVNYHFEPAGLVREVTTRVASTDDGGGTWTIRAQVNAKEPGSVSGAAAQALCGASRCDGYWIHEVPFLVDDPTDIAERRFKIFTHRYFLYPPAWQTGGDLAYHLGAIRMRAAPTPLHLPFAPEENVFRFPSTPPELGAGGTLIDACIAVSEGSGKSIAGQLYVTLACTYEYAPGDLRQRIVLLRSFDHAASWHPVSVVLDVADAERVGAKHFSASDLFFANGAAWLSATPVDPAGRYAGCLVFLFEDLAAGRLYAPNGVPYVHRVVPTEEGRFGGACSFDPSLLSGILMSQLSDGEPDPFRIHDSGIWP